MSNTSHLLLMNSNIDLVPIRKHSLTVPSLQLCRMLMCTEARSRGWGQRSNLQSAACKPLPRPFGFSISPQLYQLRHHIITQSVNVWCAHEHARTHARPLQHCWDAPTLTLSLRLAAHDRAVLTGPGLWGCWRYKQVSEVSAHLTLNNPKNKCRLMKRSKAAST